MTPPCEPVGLHEIADRLGVARQTVYNWRYDANHGRGGDNPFPDSRWTVAGNPAWNWPDVEAWAVATGRLKEAASVPVQAGEDETPDRETVYRQWDGDTITVQHWRINGGLWRWVGPHPASEKRETGGTVQTKADVRDAATKRYRELLNHDNFKLTIKNKAET